MEEGLALWEHGYHRAVYYMLWGQRVGGANLREASQGRWHSGLLRMGLPGGKW